MECDVCGRKDDECKIRTIKGKNLCPKHLTQWYRYGSFLDYTIYDDNEYILFEKYAKILLKNKYGGIVGEALIDLEDVDRCKEYKWHLRKAPNTNYVVAHTTDGKKIQLHRFILNYNGSDDIDHIFHDGLDNRKEMLRIVSHSKNLQNQKNNRNGIKQVPSGKYQASITKDYKFIYLGTYDTYEEALKARQRAEI